MHQSYTKRVQSVLYIQIQSILGQIDDLFFPEYHHLANKLLYTEPSPTLLQPRRVRLGSFKTQVVIHKPLKRAVASRLSQEYGIFPLVE